MMKYEKMIDIRLGGKNRLQHQNQRSPNQPNGGKGGHQPVHAGHAGQPQLPSQTSPCQASFVQPSQGPGQQPPLSPPSEYTRTRQLEMKRMCHVDSLVGSFYGTVPPGLVQSWTPVSSTASFRGRSPVHPDPLYKVGVPANVNVAGTTHSSGRPLQRSTSPLHRSTSPLREQQVHCNTQSVNPFLVNGYGVQNVPPMVGHMGVPKHLVQPDGGSVGTPLLGAFSQNKTAHKQII